MWHQDHCSETQEAQAVWVHPHRPERKAGRDKRVSAERVKGKGAHMKTIKPLREIEHAACTYPKWKHILYAAQCGKHIHAYYPPVKERGEDENTEDAEGQNVEDIGQEHLPFTVKTILTLLITDSSQCRDCWGKTGRVRQRGESY